MPNYLERVWKTLLSDSLVVKVIFTFPHKDDTERMDKFFGQMEEFVSFLEQKFPRTEFDFDDQSYSNAVEWSIGPISDEKQAERTKRLVESYLRSRVTDTDFSVTLS